MCRFDRVTYTPYIYYTDSCYIFNVYELKIRIFNAHSPYCYDSENG